MTDEGPRPSARRVLVQGNTVDQVAAKLPTYEALDRRGPTAWPVGLRGPSDAGWVQVDIDPGMPEYHFHNFGVWLLGVPGEPDLPQQVILQSRGPVAVDYWLVPHAERGSLLHGRRADGSPYAYELAGGVVETDRNLQAPPASARLALFNRGVPTDLIEDWEALPLVQEHTLTPWDLDDTSGFLGRFISGLFGRR